MVWILIFIAIIFFIFILHIRSKNKAIEREQQRRTEARRDRITRQPIPTEERDKRRYSSASNKTDFQSKSNLSSELDENTYNITPDKKEEREFQIFPSVLDSSINENKDKGYATYHGAENYIYRRGATFDRSATNIPYYFIFDSETTGVRSTDRIVQLAWVLLDQNFGLVKTEVFYLNPGINIPSEATRIHHITNKMVNTLSKPHEEVISLFYDDLNSCYFLIGHNVEFDIRKIDYESNLLNLNKKSLFDVDNIICTMKKGTNYCKITPRVYGKYKWPKLEELASECGFSARDSHDALDDSLTTAKCFELMVKDEYLTIKPNPTKIGETAFNYQNKERGKQPIELKENKVELDETALRKEIENYSIGQLERLLKSNRYETFSNDLTDYIKSKIEETPLLDRLKRKRENLRINIIKNRNRLEFQSERKQVASNPMPKGMARAKLENKLKNLIQEKANIENQIIELLSSDSSSSNKLDILNLKLLSLEESYSLAEQDGDMEAMFDIKNKILSIQKELKDLNKK